VPVLGGRDSLLLYQDSIKLDPLLLKIKSGSINQPSAVIHSTIVIVSPRSNSARLGQDKREPITFLGRP
jgi:hypothetical protein